MNEDGTAAGKRIEASKKQAIGGFVICWSIAVLEARYRFWGVAFAVICFAGILRFKLGVMRDARTALELGVTSMFAQAQRRSHRSRGRVFVWTAPLFVAAVWVGVMAEASRDPVRWCVLTMTTAFLGYAWFRWKRVLRAIES